MSQMTWRKRSKPTLALMLVAAVLYFVFAVTVLACGFHLDTKYETNVATNYSENYYISTTADEMVEVQWTGTQYWFGFPMLLTSALVAMSGVFQQNRLLNTLTFSSFVVCLALSLFAMLIDSGYWIWWQSDRRKLDLWEDKHGLVCETDTADSTITCICTTKDEKRIKYISYYLSCSDLKTIPGLYAGVTVSAIFCFVLSLIGIVLYSRTSPWKSSISYVRTEFVNSDGRDGAEDNV